MQEEIWKDIEGSNGNYLVSNIGRIKSKSRNIYKQNRYGKYSFFNISERILKQSLDKDGYCSLNIEINGRRITQKVHRIVAKHFILNPENKPEVNHKNGAKNQNNTDNLEWATRQENIDHSWSTGLSKINPNFKITNKNVNEFGGCGPEKLVINTETGIYYFGAKEAHSSNNFKYGLSAFIKRLSNITYNDTPFCYSP